MDVYFYEAFEEEVEALRCRLPSRLKAGFTWKTIQEQGDTEPPAKLISIRTQSEVPAGWGNKVAGIVSRTTGYDHLVGQRIPGGYLPLYCSRAVAEQAILFMMALLRKLPLQLAQFPKFHRDGLTGRECVGNNLLVVGVGNIGSEVAKIGMGLGMNVRGVDILRKHPFVRHVTIEDGLPWADVIVCAMNLTAENTAYFRYETLKRAKPGVVFVNVARGEFSPLADLARLLSEKHLGGVALDVYEREKELAIALRSSSVVGTGCSGEDAASRLVHTLLGHPNVICTPHNAFNTIEAVERKAEQTVQQIEHFLQHDQFLWPVP